MGMWLNATWLDLAREVFPDEDDRTLDFILWEYTGFPNFFHGDPETECRQQLIEAKEAMARGDVYDMGRGWVQPGAAPAPAATPPAGRAG